MNHFFRKNGKEKNLVVGNSGISHLFLDFFNEFDSSPFVDNAVGFS